MSDNKENVNADSTIEKMIELFHQYSDDFGIEWEECLKSQCEFEDKFNQLICEYKGHEVGPDQCGIPEHDYCCRCRKLRVDIEGA